MNIYAPCYYYKFKCKMDKCAHTCCVGWEIDIDSDTLEYYNSLEGTFAERIRRSISYDDCAHFVLDKDERCPFLNKSGLCDIITELGEDSLCDICSDHPRFRNFYSDHTEIGLGLSCEAVSELILNSKDVFSIVPIDADEYIKLTYEEKQVLDTRDRLINLMTDRKISIAKRFEMIAEDIGDLNKWLDFYLRLERLDNSWTDILKNIRAESFFSFDTDDRLAIPLEQLMVYFLFRHIPSAIDDGDITSKIRFCLLSCNIINTLCISEIRNNPQKEIISTFMDIARMYSSEIEYSDENICLIMKEIK